MSITDIAVGTFIGLLSATVLWTGVNLAVSSYSRSRIRKARAETLEGILSKLREREKTAHGDFVTLPTSPTNVAGEG